MILVGVDDQDHLDRARAAAQERAARAALHGERSGSVTSAPNNPPTGGTSAPHAHPATTEEHADVTRRRRSLSSPRVGRAHLRLLERIHEPDGPGPGGEQHDLPPAA